jgi:hypothetical protein
MKASWALGLISLVSTNAAIAYADPAADSSHRTPEMAQTDFFLGTWDCDVHRYPGPMGEKRYKSTIVTKADLGGNWTSIRNSSEETTVAGYSGYDRNSKKFVRVAFDDHGGMEVKTSTGWTGDDWVYEGKSSVMGREVPLRHTLTKRGEREFYGKYELEFGGKYMTVRDETCKKR